MSLCPFRNVGEQFREVLQKVALILGNLGTVFYDSLLLLGMKSVQTQSIELLKDSVDFKNLLTQLLK